MLIFEAGLEIKGSGPGKKYSDPTDLSLTLIF